MALLELRNKKSHAVVELGEAPLPFGFDAERRLVCGKPVAEKIGSVEGRTLRWAGGERLLEPGVAVDVDGVELTLHADEADLHAAALNEIAGLLWSVRDADELLGRVLDAVLRVLKVERATIALRDDDDAIAPRVTRGEGLELNASVVQATIESSAAILTSSAAVEDSDDGESGGFTIDVRSVLCAPLHDFGVLYVDNAGRRAHFTNQELEFTSGIAQLASYAASNLATTRALEEENTLLKRRLGLGGEIVHASDSMATVFERVEKAAGFDATVLITGESGVGKEMVARELHRQSPRSEHLFVAVNCAAIPETLLESELFGYASQSGIAGADPKGRAGRFEQAEFGTIFLDEIGEMKPELQVKLLRILQDKMIDRLGGAEPRHIDVRIVVATNQKLALLVREGAFREDLYYRLNVVTIEVPPLRRRRADIEVLTEFFLRNYPGPESLRKVGMTKAALKALKSYDWPGNVRELKNCIEQALIMGDGKAIRVGDLPAAVRANVKTDVMDEDLEPLSEIEKRHIARVLKATGWNKAKSSRILGISKPTLYDKIRNCALKPDAPA